MKSIFSSITIWSVILMLFTAISPELERIASFGEVKTADIIRIINILAVTGLTIISRYHDDSPLFTPKGFPGRDKV